VRRGQLLRLSLSGFSNQRGMQFNNEHSIGSCKRGDVRPSQYRFEEIAADRREVADELTEPGLANVIANSGLLTPGL